MRCGKPLTEGSGKPSVVSEREYRVLFDALSTIIGSSLMKDTCIQAGDLAAASLNEFVAQAEMLRRRIAMASPVREEPGESRGRIQILNWRRHGDNESYCQIEVFAADDTFDTQSLIEAEHKVRAGAEDEGDYAATYYVNDDITLHDGDIRVTHDCRRFLVRVVLAEAAP
jgi:hypothetical protein